MSQIGDAYASMQRMDPAERAEENDLVPTVMKAVTASRMARKGHGKALQMQWPSTAQRARQGTTDVVAIHSTKGTARHYRCSGHPQHKGHGKALQM